MSEKEYKKDVITFYRPFCYNGSYPKQKLKMLALKEKELFDEIDILPIDLKNKIVDKILSSITPTDSSIEALWIKEANKRKNEIATDSVALVEGDEVFQKIAKRLQS